MKAQVIDFAKQVRERSKRTREFLRQFNEEITRVNDGLDRLEQWFISAEIDVNNNCIDLNYAGDKHLLQALFGAMRTLGYTPGSRPTEKHIVSHTTYWNHPTLKIRFYITFSSTVCKRIKTGSKMIETPVYETVCE